MWHGTLASLPSTIITRLQQQGTGKPLDWYQHSMLQDFAIYWALKVRKGRLA